MRPCKKGQLKQKEAWVPVLAVFPMSASVRSSVPGMAVGFLNPLLSRVTRQWYGLVLFCSSCAALSHVPDSCPAHVLDSTQGPCWWALLAREPFCHRSSGSSRRSQRWQEAHRFLTRGGPSTQLALCLGTPTTAMCTSTVSLANDGAKGGTIMESLKL